MLNRTITVEHGGVSYGGEVMKIKSTSLGIEDHGIFSFHLHCEAKGSGVGVGGIGMDEPHHDDDGKFVGRRGTAFGMDLIAEVLKTAGVGSWEKLPGTSIVVLYAGSSRTYLGSMSVGFASLLGDEVLIFSEFAKAHLPAEVTA